MDLYNKAQTEAVWQRVTQTEMSAPPLVFRDLEARELVAGELCQGLYRRGWEKSLMQQLYRQSKERAQALRALGERLGELPRRARRERPEPEVLADCLGQLSCLYDPGHPLYGPLMEQFRRECVWGQSQVLSALGRRLQSPVPKQNAVNQKPFY